MLLGGELIREDDGQEVVIPRRSWSWGFLLSVGGLICWI